MMTGSIQKQSHTPIIYSATLEPIIKELRDKFYKWVSSRRLFHGYGLFEALFPEECFQLDYQRSYTYKLAIILTWLESITRPEYYSAIKLRILNALPNDTERRKLLQQTYYVKLGTIDFANFGINEVKHFRDDDQVGSGNVLYDIARSIHSIAPPGFSEIKFRPELVDFFVDNLSIIHAHLMQTAPENPLVEFFKHPQIALTILQTAEHNPNHKLLHVIIKEQYSGSQLQFWRERAKLNDHTLAQFMQQSMPPEPNESAEHMQMRLQHNLGLARELYLNNEGADLQYDYLIALLTTEMTNGFRIFFAIPEPATLEDPDLKPQAPVDVRSLVTKRLYMSKYGELPGETFESFVQSLCVEKITATVRPRSP